MSSSSGAVRMTDGPIWKRMLVFAIPIFWGHLFQQLYNSADSLIVGRYLGSEALAAVSSSANLIHLMVGFFQGVSLGASVVIARYFGAQDTENVQKSIHTTVLLGGICSLILALIGSIVAPHLLILMDTPADVLPNSITYFRIYFAGSMGLVMYNCFVGILQAVGDSKHPLFYLMIASIVNIVLDFFFIAVLGFGVGAAAFATVISQCLSAFLCMLQLMRSPEEYRLCLHKLRIDFGLVKLILENGIPSGIQNSIISIANVFVQSNINAFGKYAMAGCGVYNRVQGFAFLPITCFTMALSTFISQNLGAKEYDRARAGSKFGVTCCAIIAEIIGVLCALFSPQLMKLFSDVPEVITFGVRYARFDSMFFFLLALSHSMAAIMRGSGNAKVPMYVMLLTWCLARVSFISIVVRIIPKIDVVYWAYPLTWAMSSVIFLWYYLKSDWIHGLDAQTVQN